MFEGLLEVGLVHRLDECLGYRRCDDCDVSIVEVVPFRSRGGSCFCVSTLSLGFIGPQPLKWKWSGDVAQLGRAPALQAGGRGFESHRLHRDRNGPHRRSGYAVGTEQEQRGEAQ